MMKFAAAALIAAVAVNAADVPVKVGPLAATGVLTFDPQSVTAAAGDTVTFTFYPKNHSVTQSTFDAPCTKIGDTAIASGFKSVADAASVTASPTTFVVTVNDTKPLWFYCGQTLPANHCNLGMVFAINAPTSGNTIDKFVAAAKALAAPAASGASGAPGPSGSATSPSGSGSASSPSASGNGTGGEKPAGGDALATGASVGLVGLLAGVAALLGLF